MGATVVGMVVVGDGRGGRGVGGRRGGGRVRSREDFRRVPEKGERVNATGGDRPAQGPKKRGRE